MRNSTRSIKNIFLATAAFTAFASTPLMAAENDFVSGATLSRQIVVQKKGEKAEVKNLVAKLKDSQNSLANNTVKFRAPKVTPEAEATETVQQFRAPKPTPDPVVEEEQVAGVEPSVKETIENETADDVFAPKTEEKVKAKTHKVKMPTVFTPEQVALYNKLSEEEQIALVRRLATKYGLSKLYPTKKANNYYDNKYTRKHSYSQKYNNHSNSYSHNNSYSSAYSTSNYSASGCRK